jgi:PhzF family phenazine biosynthesis protein
LAVEIVGGGWQIGSMRRFAQVDVFTHRAGYGNPVAVVLDAEGLDDEQLAQLARWTNLSETTFVLPPTTPGADYRVRIFTASYEMPMAGHPTLGTSQALIDAGLLPERPVGGEWVQECLAGLIPVRLGEGGTLSFAAPVAQFSESPLSDVQLVRVLGLAPADPLVINVGPDWLTGRVELDELDSLSVDSAAFLEVLEPKLAVGITLYAVDDQREVHVRSFFEGAGVFTEDPVCGTGNAAVGAHLLRTGHAGDVPATYQARQGRHRHRDGRITVTPGERVWVGGQAITVVSGTIAV